MGDGVARAVGPSPSPRRNSLRIRGRRVAGRVASPPSFGGSLHAEVVGVYRFLELLQLELRPVALSAPASTPTWATRRGVEEASPVESTEYDP